MGIYSQEGSQYLWLHNHAVTVLEGAPKSKATIDLAERLGFKVRTKTVKRIPIDIDVSGIAAESPEVLKRIMPREFLKLLPLKTVEGFNECLRALNKSGTLRFENMKCNFDVEIGTDMHVDKMLNQVDNFLLWSGDSDFADLMEQLLDAGKTVTVFATTGRIARELIKLQGKGLRIFEVRKLREFLCWNRERTRICRVRDDT